MKRYIDVIMAGFGGQGVLLIGNLLAYAGMREKLNVTYIPVYGVEMRGAYLAAWRESRGQWRLERELYVTLKA